MVEVYTKDLHDLDWEAALPLLTEQRREKTARIHDVAEKKRSVGAGLLLRERFGEGVLLTFNQYGRPQLAGKNQPWISLSHTGELVVLAVSDRPVGVDVERARCSMAVARRFFTPLEVLALEALPEEQRPRLFTRLWTAREAYLKMRGVGLMWLSDTPITLRGDTITLRGATLTEEEQDDYHIALVQA